MPQTNITTPQYTPLFMSAREESGTDCAALSAFRKNIDLAKITGSSDTVAIKKRTAMKVTGPT
jgi:hypothetical protein